MNLGHLPLDFSIMSYFIVHQVKFFPFCFFVRVGDLCLVYSVVACMYVLLSQQAVS